MCQVLQKKSPGRAAVSCMWGPLDVSCREWAFRIRQEPYLANSPPWACAWPAIASMIASWEYMLMGVLYWAWMIVALPPRPFTSMGLCVDRAESFRTLGLKRSVKSLLGYARVRFDRGGRGRKEKGVTVMWEKKQRQRGVHVCSRHHTTASSQRTRD